MDLTTTIVPKSDQLNADDLMVAPVTVTIKDVQQGSLEQPVNVNLVEYPGRAYRPSKSMRRVMVAAWGPDTTSYAGRSLTLYRNPEIKFGADKVGGIEISALSNIDAPLTVALTATRGKRKNFTVAPLATDAAPAKSISPEDIASWTELINDAATLEDLQRVWAGAVTAGVTKDSAIVAAKDARKNELSA